MRPAAPPSATAPISGSQLVIDAIAAQRDADPDAIALQWGAKALSYRELDARATALARRLRADGVAPDVLVALSVDRSFDMVIGVLGILKAGGAYLPIDPAYPAGRIAFVLEDSRATILVTQRAVLAGLPSITTRTVLLEEPGECRDETAETAPIIADVRPDHLAYVLYTSGSTGQPKGVGIEHRALTNFLDSMRVEPGLSRADVLLAITTLSFDIAGLELLLPLTTGARIILAPREVATDGAAMMRAMEDHGVTVLQATPASWRLLLAAGWTGTPGLKALCGGEPLPTSLAEKLLPRCNSLWNMYGPTETTIWSTCTRVVDAHDVHIGRPIANTTISICQENGSPVANGEEGELLIGGLGLARGYLHRPDLTAQRFITDPAVPSQRLYRTGDLARWRPDGNVECLGRIDHQVKIRGHRIELGEIEAQLSRHPGVRHAVVIARPAADEDARLVAYFVTAGQCSPDPRELRAILHRALPGFMVPAAFVALPQLPLTPNGKVDRMALPPPQSRDFVSGGNVVAPRNQNEQCLLTLFSRVLDQTVSSVEDSFFDLGGTSLMAARLIMQIEHEFGVRLPLARMLHVSTVAALARDLPASTDRSLARASLVPIAPRPGRPALFLVHGAGGNVLLYRELAAALGPGVSVFGFQALGVDGSTPPLTTVETMAEHYLRELRAAQPRGPYHLGGYCMGGTVALEMARRLRAAGEPVGLVALLDTYNFHTVKLARAREGWLWRTVEKMQFHGANLFALNWRSLPGYVAEKAGRAWQAIVARCVSVGQSLRAPASGRRSRFPAHVITGIHEQAAWDFVPGTFDGVVTVFAPQQNYAFYADPDFGWSDLLRDRLQIVRLPCNPHAMLLAPCVSQLATEIRNRLLTPDTHRGRPPDRSTPRFPAKSLGSANDSGILADGQSSTNLPMSQSVPSPRRHVHNQLVPTRIQLPH